ncbi:MAG: hypothetical protein WCY29_06025 [Novosphingobium sp.]
MNEVLKVAGLFVFVWLVVTPAMLLILLVAMVTAVEFFRAFGLSSLLVLFLAGGGFLAFAEHFRR